MVFSNQPYSHRSDSTAEAVAMLLSIPVIKVVAGIARGIVLSILWPWFVQSVFPKAPGMSVAQAIGIALILGMFTNNKPSASNTQSLDKFGPWGLILYMPAMVAISPLFVLACGWIVLQFI